MSDLISICYGLISFFVVILHNIFLLYHVDVFVNIYKIDKLSFWIAEIIFLLWNSFNDPLFGWISDSKYLQNGICTSQREVVEKRLKALMWNGPLLCFGFLMFWFSWNRPFIQFIFCLCAYDGFLTMVDLNHSALLADLSVSLETRTHLNMLCSLFNAIGSLLVFVSYIFWDKTNYSSFQSFCFITTIIALVGFPISIITMKWTYDSSCQIYNGNKVIKATESKEKDVMKKFVWQLSRHKNFLLFSAMNLIQVFHCHFNSNFFPMFLSILLGENASPTICSLLLGVSFVAPHINNMYFLTLCRKYGTYKIIRFLFVFKLLLALLMYLCGRNNVCLLSVFIASNRVFTEGTCKLLNLVITDLVDEDFVINHRKQAVSALIFGTIAFFSKPGQTFAAIIGTVLLSVYTGRDIFKRHDFEMKESMMDEDVLPSYEEGVFSLLIIIPIVCSVLQLASWHFFDLHGRRLNLIKALRSHSKMTSVV